MDWEQWKCDKILFYLIFPYHIKALQTRHCLVSSEFGIWRMVWPPNEERPHHHHHHHHHSIIGDIVHAIVQPRWVNPPPQQQTTIYVPTPPQANTVYVAPPQPPQIYVAPPTPGAPPGYLPPSGRLHSQIKKKQLHFFSLLSILVTTINVSVPLCILDSDGTLSFNFYRNVLTGMRFIWS